MKCGYCGQTLDYERTHCPLCGTPVGLVELEKPVFGRGQPMEFFNWLYKYLPYFYLASIAFTLASLYHILVNLYKGNVALFTSIFANTVYLNMRFANIVFMVIIIVLRYRKDKVNFARMFVFKHMLQITELIVLYVVGGAQIGIVEGLTETFVREMFFNLLVFIPIFNYFNKRITIFGFGED